jgi:hypothetical protein
LTSAFGTAIGTGMHNEPPPFNRPINANTAIAGIFIEPLPCTAKQHLAIGKTKAPAHNCTWEKPSSNVANRVAETARASPLGSAKKSQAASRTVAPAFHALHASVVRLQVSRYRGAASDWRDGRRPFPTGANASRGRTPISTCSVIVAQAGGANVCRGNRVDDSEERGNEASWGGW